jgi:hypothetical protein
MGLNFMDINSIPHLTSPLKGEEQDKLAHMGLRRLTNHLATVLWLLSGMASSSINDAVVANSLSGLNA